MKKNKKKQKQQKKKKGLLGEGVWVGGDFNGWDDGAGPFGVPCSWVEDKEMRIDDNESATHYFWAPENTISVGDAFLFFVRNASGHGQVRGFIIIL